MQRIAIMYSGEIRSLLLNLSNHYEFVFLPNIGCQIDLFGHFWSEGKLLNDLVEQRLNAKKIVFEPKKFENNIESQFYSIKQSNLQRIAYEQENNFVYDRVVRMRSDAVFYQLVTPFYELDSSKIHTCMAYRALAEYEVHDQFAVGSSKNMTKFLNVFDKIDEMKNMGCVKNQECYLGFNALKLENLIIEEHPWKIFLNRYLNDTI